MFVKFNYCRWLSQKKVTVIQDIAFCLESLVTGSIIYHRDAVQKTQMILAGRFTTEI